jgi:hypothetical protein
MKRTFAFAAVVLAAAVLAGGCGGSDDEDSEASDATVWAGQLCTAASSWAEVLTSTVDGLRAGNVSKEDLEAAADDVKTATQTLVDDIEDLPRPNTDAGEQAKETVDELADELQQDADTIEDAVDDVSGASDVLSAVSTVGATLATMGSRVTSTVNEVRELDARGELTDAFQNAVPCRELSGLAPS